MMKDNWQYQLRDALKGAQMCNDFFQTDVFKEGGFPIKIPLEYAKLIDKTNPNDPLLKQVLHSQTLLESGIKKPDFSNDPLKDEEFSPIEGLIHKYPNRILLITSRVCAIHCQYCFRQNFDYARHDAISNFAAIERYIHAHKEINEVILSGGDPLSLSDEKLLYLIRHIEDMTHIKTLRIHSRSAVATPSRITDKLVNLLSNTVLNVVLVVHVNHARELSPEAAIAIGKFQNITLLNQSVLLKDVNDSLEALSALSLRLFDLGILPYYLHLLDKVTGAEHFLVDDKRACVLHQQLKQTLSGYLVPKLVRDENLESKTWV